MRIMFLSDSPKMNSGYSIVTSNLSIGLRKLGYDVIIVGLQTGYVSEYLNIENGEKIEVLPILTDKADEIGQLMSHIQDFSPDHVIYVGNLGDSDSELPNLAKVFPGTICYVPINGKDIPLGIVNDLNGIVKRGGRVLAMCKYGYDEMKRSRINIDRYIYHGYNDNIFKKINSKNRMDIKSGDIVSILKWSSADEGKTNRWVQYNVDISNVGDLLGYGKKTIFLHIGQNIGIRKRQERLLTAYAIMIKDNKMMKDRTCLHMHCLPISGRGLNLIEVAMKLGIKENVSFSYGNYLSAGWSEDALNILYNLADVHISASSSEGFGLPTIESMACGLPNVAPDCTSFTELIGNDPDENKNRGLLAKISDWQMIPMGRYLPLVSERNLAENMKKLYIDEKLREKLGNNGMKWVQKLDWKNICDQWNELLNSV